MPRNGSGVYTLPAGNPVVPGTTIDSGWANDTLEDVANELTNSLSRTGAAGMLAPFRIADGNVTAPGLAFLNETNSGLYRSGSGSLWMSILGVNVAQYSTTGLTVPAGKAFTAQGNASVTGTFAVTGAVTFTSTLALTGALTATGGVLGNVTAASCTSTFNNITINGDPLLIPVQSNPNWERFRIADPQGIFLFRVGGTLNVNAGQLPGVYTGTFDIRLDYQ